MAVDKSQIRQIKDFQLGSEVAANMKFNFDMLADEINKNEASLNPDALVKTEQTLNEKEQTQVQTNIGVKNTVDVVGAGTPIKVTEVFRKNGWRNSDGNLSELSGFDVFKAIKVNKGDIILGTCGATENTAVISRVDTNNNFKYLVLKGIDGTNKIFKTLDFDGYIEFCSYSDTLNVTIIPCKLVSTLIPPGGPNRKLYEAAGAKFNKKTGFYELNGLTDITEDEMATIYAYPTTYIGFGTFDGCKARTLLRFPTSVIADSTPNLSYTFRWCTRLEILVLNTTYPCVTSVFSSTFSNSVKLKSIVGVIDLKLSGDLSNAFLQCTSLMDVNIKNLKKNIEFKDSPLLSKESLQYMVANSAAVSPITITLHADVYTKVDSAEAEWGDIFTLSQTKNISFVQG